MNKNIKTSTKDVEKNIKKSNKILNENKKNDTILFDGLRGELLEEISSLHAIPQTPISIRENGSSKIYNSNEEIRIVSKKDKNGLDIFIAPNTKNKSVHLPVIITQSNIHDIVYNDFYIAENCDILIVAGCGIHTNIGESSHNGVHNFLIGQNSKVKYIEKHLGLGKEKSKKVLNPTTNVEIKSNSLLEMETIQLGGVSFSKRITNVKIGENSKFIVKEKILTTNNQKAVSYFDIDCEGCNSKTEIVSRSVAKNNSYQEFNSNVKGKNVCFGRVECDGIVMDNAKICSTPKIDVEDARAELSHEAQIGKIANEQLTKLQTLGLNLEEAENLIISGFLC